MLHRDLKGSNLLLDGGGNVKIADFGLATFFHSGKKQQLTGHVVTLWYRSPELLLGATEYGVGVDLWSAGCILGELFTGSPIMPGRTEVEQLHKIFKLCGSPSEEYWQKYKLPNANIFKPQRPYARSVAETFKDVPRTALDLLDALLAIDPQARGTASAALKSEFFTSKPVACNPSSLPKLPTEKESDTRLSAVDRAKRGKADSRKTHKLAHKLVAPRRGSSSKDAALKDRNTDLVSPFEKQHTSVQAITKARSSSFSHQKEEPATVMPADGGKDAGVHENHTHTLPSDPVKSDSAWDRKQWEEGSNLISPLSMPWDDRYARVSSLKFQGTYRSQQTADLSKLSTLVAARNNGSQDRKDLASGKQQDRGHSGFKTIKYERPDMIEVVKHQAQKEPQVNACFEKTASLDLRHAGSTARIHFSGPLLHSNATPEDKITVYQAHIQKALCQARHYKGKNQQEVTIPRMGGVDGMNSSREAFDVIDPTLVSIDYLRTAKSHYLSGDPNPLLGELESKLWDARFITAQEPPSNPAAR